MKELPDRAREVEEEGDNPHTNTHSWQAQNQICLQPGREGLAGNTADQLCVQQAIAASATLPPTSLAWL